MGDYTINEYVDVGCEQTTPNFLVFVMLHAVTNGKVCPGCGFSSNCKAKAKLGKPELGKPEGFTNRQLAEKFHCSKRQISKMRKAGTLEEPIKD